MRPFDRSQNRTQIIMKRNLLPGLMTLLAVPLLAAEANPQADVKNAPAGLGSHTNYSWRTTVEAGNNSRFRPGPTEGKTEKGGYTTLWMSFGDNTNQARSEEHTSELQSLRHLVCRLLLEKKKKQNK